MEKRDLDFWQVPKADIRKNIDIDFIFRTVVFHDFHLIHNENHTKSYSDIIVFTEGDMGFFEVLRREI